MLKYKYITMNIIASLVGSSISTFIYFLFSYLFDKELSHKGSNIISYLISIGVDITLQTFFFKKFHLLKDKTFLTKAVLFECISLFINQTLFNVLYDYNKKKKKNINILYIRMFVSLIIFLLYTYPMRKYILFI
jgi:hypothetical protein